MRGWLEIPLLIALGMLLLYMLVKCGSQPPAHPYFRLPTPAATGGK